MFNHEHTYVFGSFQLDAVTRCGQLPPSHVRQIPTSDPSARSTGARLVSDCRAPTEMSCSGVDHGPVGDSDQDTNVAPSPSVPPHPEAAGVDPSVQLQTGRPFGWRAAVKKRAQSPLRCGEEGSRTAFTSWLKVPKTSASRT